MSDKQRDASIAHIQRILDRDYGGLEWRVLRSPPPGVADPSEPAVAVYARTRDFRYRCRVDRPWSAVATAPTLELFVAGIAAEAEQRLAELAGADA